MKNNNYILSGLFAFILLFSCSDFLDKEPYYLLNENNAITDYDKAKAAIGGIYSTFNNDSWSGALYTSLASKAGFVKWSEPDYELEYNQSSLPYAVPDIWRNFYKTLNAANFATNGISELPLISVPSESAKTALVAEARGLRAWASANLLWNFGHWWANDNDQYGLLYRDKVVNLSNVQQARMSVGESYAIILEDLDYAIANLPSFTNPRHMSKEFAKVLKAKILLYRGGYNNDTDALNEALLLVNDVLNNPPSGFAMDQDLENMYQDSWDSKENLFVKYLEDNSSRQSSAGFQYRYGIIYNGDRLPLAVGLETTAGLNYGLDWFKSDARWDVVTGPVRAPEAWDDTNRYTWKKLARLGGYAGTQASPRDEKWATYWFRYPELYIMKAELMARIGASVADAIAPINVMRSKRTNPTLPSLNPSNQNELMDAIFQEYFFELFLENGSEFFAATRFKNNAGTRWIEVMKDGKPLVENKLCWPIPPEELIGNPLMIQNPDLE